MILSSKPSFLSVENKTIPFQTKKDCLPNRLHERRQRPKVPGFLVTRFEFIKMNEIHALEFEILLIELSASLFQRLKMRNLPKIRTYLMMRQDACIWLDFEKIKPDFAVHLHSKKNLERRICVMKYFFGIKWNFSTELLGKVKLFFMTMLGKTCRWLVAHIS